jgi:hypothetical protein
LDTAILSKDGLSVCYTIPVPYVGSRAPTMLLRYPEEEKTGVVEPELDLCLFLPPNVKVNRAFFQKISLSFPEYDNYDIYDTDEKD